MKERENWENIVRSKLENFEADTIPEDWAAIADRLPETRKADMPLRRWHYAAAAVALLFALSGGYFFLHRPVNKPAVANVPETSIPNATSLPADTPALHAEKTVAQLPASKPAPAANKQQTITPREPSLRTEATTAELPAREMLRTPPPSRNKMEAYTLIADAKPAPGKKNARRRWGIGMGGGGYAIGTNGAEPLPLFNRGYNTLINAESVTSLRSEEKKQDISHKLPVSFGLGVGYALNDRWSLQSGLNYTMLSSEWMIYRKYQEKSRQRLHFIGLPIGLSYKIAEWNRFHFYASAGMMTEWNVSGHIRTDYYHDLSKVQTETQSLRMKEWQWSVNARAGVSYPLIRYVNAFAEGGANYYFNNGSSIETIRSDKPFYISLQAGIRLGF
jgi:opacity protein-like surface antigen